MHAGIDFSRFKKVSSDKKTTTLRHTNGHELKIAHSALTPKLREQLECLPQHDEKVTRFKEGGEVEKKEKETEKDDIDPASPAPLNDAAAPAAAFSDPSAENAELGGPSEGQAAPVPDTMGQARAEAAPQTAAPEDIGPLGADTNAPDASQQLLPDQGALANEPAVSPEEAAGIKPVSFQPEQQPIDQPADVAAQLKNDNELYKNDLAAGHIKPETYHSLFAKQDTLGKIGTLFGLMVSGAGAGLSHQPNAVMEMMNRTIQNDLDAQKASAGNAQNFIRLMQQHELNQANIKHIGAQQQKTEAETKTEIPARAKSAEAAATLAEAEAKGVPSKIGLTKAQTLEAAVKGEAGANILANRAAFHKLVTDIDKMPEGAQKQQKLQSLALMSQNVDAENYNIADRAAAKIALVHLINPPASTPENSENSFTQGVQGLKLSGMGNIADDMTARHIPGIKGQASVPLTEGDRQQVTQSQQLMGSLARLKAFSQANPRPSRGSKADIEGKALAAQVQGDFRLATKGGVYKEGEQNFINQVVPGDPTTWNPFAHVTDKIDTVYNETKARNDQLLKAKGFPDQQESAKTKVVNGITYKRGPNGEAIPVSTSNTAKSK